MSGPAFTVSGKPPGSSDAVTLVIFRIVQESLTNVVEHAHASRVDVQIDYGSHQATVAVVNDAG